MDRIQKEEVECIKERFLESLKIPYAKIRDSLYIVSGKKVNVKLTTTRSSGRYWFNIQKKCNSYIWICYKPEIYFWEAYYWVPAEEMWACINKGSYIDGHWQIPTFEIDPRLDLYIGGKNVRISIQRFRNLMNPPD